MKLRSVKTAFPRSGNPRRIAVCLTLGALLLPGVSAPCSSPSEPTDSPIESSLYYGAKAEEIALGGLETAIAVLTLDARENSFDHLFERWAIYYQNDDGFAYRASDPPSSDDWEKAADLSDYDELEYHVDETGDLGTVRKNPWREPLPDSRWIKVMETDPTTGEERLVGRYAVCIEDENGKVNINTAGNPDPTEIKNNYRWRHRSDMGFTTAEVDLGEVLQSLGELFHDAIPDIFDYPDYPHNVDERTALDLVTYRYGHDPQGLDPEGYSGKELNNYVPGTDGDDNSTSSMPVVLRQNTNGIDDDADGLIDEEGEDIDEPGEFDPYEPMAIGAPGEVLSDYMDEAGTTGVMGNDTPFLTVPHIKMAWSTGRPDGSGQFARYSIMDLRPSDGKPPYPADALYRCLLPFITVYSQDRNRISEADLYPVGGRGAIEWARRENIARWLTGRPSEVYASLQWMKSKGIAFTSSTDHDLRQLAVNIYDFIDPDWLPTAYGDVVGVEPVAYLNEIEASPPDVPGTVAGLGQGTVVEDYGEYLELWNPYDVPIDVRNYYVTVNEHADPQPIRPMAVASTVIPPRSFFVIGDTLGDVVNVTQGTRLPDQQLPPYPPGCQAYAPINLDPPYVDIYLEMRAPGLGRIPLETHHPIPFAPVQHMTLQKDDPRVSWHWNVAPPTPGRMNARMSNMDNVYSYFYVPGLRFRSRDPSFDPSDLDLLKHAGGVSSIGELGMAHRANAWQTLNLTGESASYLGDRTDGRLLDLLTLPYQYRYTGTPPVNDEFPARESVPGRININTAAPEVLLGLNWAPMIEDLRSYNLRVTPALSLDFIRHIIQRRKYAPYQALWEVAQDFADFMEKRAGLANAPDAAKEAFLRHNANLITTKSSVFKVTVVAESFDAQGNVQGNAELEAVVDRGFTPGSLGRSGEDNPTRDEKARAETARTLYFRWVSEPRSMAEISASTGGGFQVMWTSAPGRLYTIWSCTDLLAGSWKEEKTLWFPGVLATWADPETVSGGKFYRIEVK